MKATPHILNVGQHTKSLPHKQHIWFLQTLKPNAEKTKRAVFFPTLEKTQSEYRP